MAKTKKKNYALVVLFVLLIGISVGYAAFGQTLRINGTANANGNFKLAFTSATISPNVGAEGSTTSISANGDTLSINMNLEYPGAGGVVNTTITNTGSIAAKLNGLKYEGINDPDINVSFSGVTEGEVIEPGETKEVTITVKWAENSTTAKTLDFKATLDYIQSTENFEVNTTPEDDQQT